MGLSNVDKYKHIIIEESDNKFLIKIIDSNNGVMFIECLMDEIGINNMCELIQMYINTFGVNGMNKSIPIIRSVSKKQESYAEVICANSENKISMKIYDPKYKFISKMIADKYFACRDKTLKNTEFNEIRISADPDISKYEINGKVVNLVLSTDFNVNIRNSEKDFIRDLLEYKCGKKKMVINFLDGKYSDERKCVVTCGDLKIVFPRGYTYSTILGIIYDHNFKIDEMRKRR